MTERDIRDKYYFSLIHDLNNENILILQIPIDSPADKYFEEHYLPKYPSIIKEQYGMMRSYRIPKDIWEAERMDRTICRTSEVAEKLEINHLRKSRSKYFSNKDEAFKFAHDNLQDGLSVVIKQSRGHYKVVIRDMYPEEEGK